MKELLDELKALIEAGDKEAAKAKVDEVAKKVEDIEHRPLPGEGSNGRN